jgi:hypothetical protein
MLGSHPVAKKHGRLGSAREFEARSYPYTVPELTGTRHNFVSCRNFALLSPVADFVYLNLGTLWRASGPNSQVGASFGGAAPKTAVFDGI